MFAKTVLSNGIRILSERRPEARSVSLGIWVENGSRHEARHQNGISHFIEHLLFKGTQRRSATRIAEEMDSVGGVLNAFTGKENTCYYAKVLDENLPMAVDLLSDLFLNSVFDREEIERERGVVLQEISQVEDAPEEYVHDLFNLDFLGDHPLSRPICGEASIVSAFQREDLVGFLEHRYLPGRVIIVAAGNVDHADLVSRIEKEFSSLKGRPLEDASAAPQFRSGVCVHPKSLEQVHLCLGAVGLAHTDSRRYVAHVLNALLGGGMSSWLFQEIREKRGKAYSVYSFLSSFWDTGYLAVYAGTHPDWVKEVVNLILAGMRNFAEGKITQEEVDRGKNQLIGNTILGLESTDSWMSQLARNEIYFGKVVSVEEITQGVRSVTLGEVVDLAREILQPQQMTLTLLGNLREESIDLKF